MASYPALEIRGADTDFALAVADDFSPSAAQPDDTGVTIYFHDSSRRDRAHDALARRFPDATILALDVDDEDWARRSQENLEPITVGLITIALPWSPAPDRPSSSTGRTSSDASPLTIVIAPSMGFGTGHHATTRLCLAALQATNLTGRFVLDVGTGSGILAIAARCLGARTAVGVDNDPDAIRSADDNLLLNPSVDGVRFAVADLNREMLPRAGAVTANLTGADLVRSAAALAGALEEGGELIVSGLLTSERAAVVAAFDGLRLVAEAREDEWVCLTFRSRGAGEL